MSEVKKVLAKKKSPDDVFKMTPEETAWLKRRAIFLRAAGRTPISISNALRVQRSVIKEWFAEPEMIEKVEEVRGEIIDAGINLIQDQFVALADNLVRIAFGAYDEKVRLTATLEAMGICGVTKINKSESVVRNKSVDATESLLQRVADLPPEQQQEAAMKANALLASITEQPT